MAEEQELTAREIVEETYNYLKNKLDGRIIRLPLEAIAEIANDLNPRKARVGYTSYRSAMLLEINGKKWALAFGNIRGYRAGLYKCDIAAVQLSDNARTDGQTAAEIHNALEGNRYFCNSLICAMADGQLIVNKNGRFSQKIVELLGPKIREFIIQELKIDTRRLTIDLRPVVESPIRYSPELIVFLSNVFHVVLMS